MKKRCVTSTRPVSNSSFGGLTVTGGRLINNSPDGIMGIKKIVQAKAMMRREEKISMIAQGYMRGEMMADFGGYDD
jgi:hypothetical protein